MSWRHVTIKEICKIKSGKRLPKGKSFSVEETNFPYIRARDIKAGKINSENLVYLDEVTQKKLSQYIVNKNDIVITVVGASVGDVGYVSADLDGYNLTENAVRLTEFDESVNSLYLLYLLNSQKYWEIMQSIAGGSAQPKLGMYKVESIPLELPTLDIQNRIVKSISTYDNLIENNQKQIKLLEEAAQRLYKEWFIDLRFPGHENVEIVDGIPEGWKMEPVGRVIKTVPRTLQIKTKDYLQDGTIPIIDQSREFIAGYTNLEDAIVLSETPVIVFGDHTRILKYIQFPFAKGADGTQLIISNTELMPEPLLYLSLLSVDLSNYHYARHFKYLKEEMIIIPSQEIADSFNNIVDSLFKRVQVLRDINRNCEQARDRLLPKLMSGEIEV